MTKGSYSAGNTASYSSTGSFSGGKAGYSSAPSLSSNGWIGLSVGSYGKNSARPGSYLPGYKGLAKGMYSGSNKYDPLAKGMGYQKISEAIADVMKAYMKLGKAVCDGITGQNPKAMDGLDSIVSSLMQPEKESSFSDLIYMPPNQNKKEHEASCFNCGKTLPLPGLCSACRN